MNLVVFLIMNEYKVSVIKFAYTLLHLLSFLCVPFNSYGRKVVLAEFNH